MCRLPDHGREPGNFAPVFRFQLQPFELAHVGNDIEHPAPANIDPDLPQMWHVDFCIQMGRKGGDIAEGHSLHLSIRALRLYAD